MGFLLLVLFGYLAGTAAKFSRAAFLGQPPEWNTTLYILNAILVAVDIVLYIRYRHNPYPACVV